MGLRPAACQHPACMPNHHNGGDFGCVRLARTGLRSVVRWLNPLAACVPAGLPRRRPFQQLHQRFATTWGVRGKGGAPGIHLDMANVGPGLAVPGAEVKFQQRGVHHVCPAPAPQPTAHVGTTLQRRGVHHPRQTCPPGSGLDAPGQAPGAPGVHRHVGAANATARHALWLRVTPHPHRRARKWCWVHGFRHPESNLKPQVPLASTSSTAISVNCSVAPSASPV